MELPQSYLDWLRIKKGINRPDVAAALFDRWEPGNIDALTSAYANADWTLGWVDKILDQRDGQHGTIMLKSGVPDVLSSIIPPTQDNIAFAAACLLTGNAAGLMPPLLRLDDGLPELRADVGPYGAPDRNKKPYATGDISMSPSPLHIHVTGLEPGHPDGPPEGVRPIPTSYGKGETVKWVWRETDEKGGLVRRVLFLQNPKLMKNHVASHSNDTSHHGSVWVSIVTNGEYGEPAWMSIEDFENEIWRQDCIAAACSRKAREGWWTCHQHWNQDPAAYAVAATLLGGDYIAPDVPPVITAVPRAHRHPELAKYLLPPNEALQIAVMRALEGSDEDGNLMDWEEPELDEDGNVRMMRPVYGHVHADAFAKAGDRAVEHVLQHHKQEILDSYLQPTVSITVIWRQGCIGVKRTGVKCTRNARWRYWTCAQHDDQDPGTDPPAPHVEAIELPPRLRLRGEHTNTTAAEYIAAAWKYAEHDARGHNHEQPKQKDRTKPVPAMRIECCALQEIDFLQRAETIIFHLENSFKSGSLMCEILDGEYRIAVFSVPSVTLWTCAELEAVVARWLVGRTVVIALDGDGYLNPRACTSVLAQVHA